MFLQDIKGAIFDMDGTLVNSLILWEVIWKRFGKLFCNGEVFAPASADDKAVRTMTLKDAMHFIHARYDIGESGDELFSLADGILRDFYENEVELKEGVAEVLAYCKDEGIKMCIASASDKELINVALKHCGIEAYFTGIFSCAEIGKGKDQPDVYLQALEHLGTKAEETCIFEDSHVAIETADRLGMKTVGIYDPNNYGADKIEKIATVYVGAGESLKKLIETEN